MEIMDDLENKEFKKKVILRKVAGWILFSFGILSLAISALLMLIMLAGILFFGALGFEFLPVLAVVAFIMFIFVVIFGGIAITLSILHLLAGLYMARGVKRGFVMVILIIFSAFVGLELLLSFYGLVSNWSGDSIGNMAAALISAGIYGFFLFALHDTWHTFYVGKKRRGAPGTVGIIYPTGEFVPRDLEEKPSIYTKEYAKELEKERRKVKSSHEETVAASGYDFGTISSGE